MDKVFLIGNTGADIEVRTTAKDVKVGTVRFATTKTVGSGEKKKKITKWHTLKIWSEALIGLFEKYLPKGSKLHVTGELNYRDWEDKEGVKRTQTEIICREVEILSTPGDSDRPAKSEEAAPAEKPAAANTDKAEPSAEPTDEEDPF